MSDLAHMPGAEPFDTRREQRLEEIRRRAQTAAKVEVTHAPSEAYYPRASAETGYYGIPLLKQPPWTWEIPLYFFVGGAAGASAVIGAVSDFTGSDPLLAKHARWIAAAGSVISPILLISDLGRPSRFLAMVRILKPQSPMSVGVWTLLGFSSAACSAFAADMMESRYGSSPVLRFLRHAGQATSLLFGLPFSNYTGVLIAVTAVPVWKCSASDLPVHFAASGVGASVGMLELMGHDRSRPLQMLGIGAAAIETLEGVRIETRSHEDLQPLKRGASGWVIRTGGVLSGPIPLALRLASLFAPRRNSASLRRWAARSAIAGSLITRYAWMLAGKQSTKNWHAPLQSNGKSSEPLKKSHGSELHSHANDNPVQKVAV
jgi:hypothetical protein